MTIIRLCAILVTTFLVSSYVIAYGPTGDYGGFPHGGYSDVRVRGNKAIVRYDGGVFTSQLKVENYVLYRCARITIDSGYDYFIVTSITTSSMNIDVKESDTHNHYVTIPPKLYTAYPDIEQFQSASESNTSMRCRYSAGAPC